MRTFLAATLSMGLMAVGSLGAQAQNPTPPTPAPMVPPPPQAVPVPAAEAAAEAEAKPETPPGPVFELKDKRECIIPGHHGDALTEGGKIDVSTPEPNELKVLMTGVVAAHCFVGCHSIGVETFQLVQEFDVTSTDPAINQAVLTFQSALNGYVRSRHKGSATMRLASATVAPAGSPVATFSVSFPPMSVCGPCGRGEYKQEYAPPAGAPLPLGRYILVANFVLEASADGLINGRGVADFSADALPDPWKQENDPFKDAERKDYGFAISLTAAAPEGATPAAPAGPDSVPAPPAANPASALRIRPMAPQVRRVSFNPAPAPAPAPAPLTTRTVAPGRGAGLVGRIAPR